MNHPNFRALIYVLLLILNSYSPQVTYADEVYTFVVKKQEEKEKVRWTLSDWLNTRDKMRMQDLWLALHSPSPYEFFIGGTYQFNQLRPGPSLNIWDINFGAFVTIFGLEGKYESAMDNRWYGAFDLRIWGYHDQSSNITLQGGLRYRMLDTESVLNPFAGVSLTIYVAKGFGIEGLYRHFFDASSTVTDSGLGGDRFQGGAFIEYHFLRLYGDYFSESNSLATLSGLVIGTKIYF